MYQTPVLAPLHSRDATPLQVGNNKHDVSSMSGDRYFIYGRSSGQNAQRSKLVAGGWFRGEQILKVTMAPYTKYSQIRLRIIMQVTQVSL